MRPRTATIQVFWYDDKTKWVVEIGDPKASHCTVLITGANLDKLLKTAIITWKDREGLGD